MTDQSDMEALRQHLRDAENALADLDHQMMDATAEQRATEGLSIEIVEITEARDFMKARLARMEGEQHGG